MQPAVNQGLKKKMTGHEMIRKLREEAFNTETEKKLFSHPYLKAAQDGSLTLAQRQAFAQAQYFIQLSDATSFATLAGHKNFLPKSLTGATVPEAVLSPPEGAKVDLFQFLLGGEVFAAPMLLAYAKSVNLDEAALAGSLRSCSAKAQTYPSYWARLALSG